jgi:hypothetical protein
MRFKRTNVHGDIGEMDKTEGFGVLDYLYEHGLMMVEETGNRMGLLYYDMMASLGGKKIVGGKRGAISRLLYLGKAQ